MLISPPVSLLGATRPRVEVAPPYAYSLGEEAVELARRAGLVLDFWQQQALVLMLAVRPDGKWACFEYAEIVARQNGKGGILEARALAGLFLFGERLIMWSAHEYKTALEAFLRFRGLVEALTREGLVDPAAVKTNNTNGEEGFELPAARQRLKFIARSKSSGRGFSGDVNVIDEAFAYTRAQQSALMPTMNARGNPQIIYTSSPPLDGGSGEPLFALRERALAGGEDSLGYRDWGVAGDLDRIGEIDLDDRALWAASNPALGIRITEETLARNRTSMTPVDFAREILGVWPRMWGAEGSVIDPALWASLADPDSQVVDPVVFAVDATPDRAGASIAVAGRRADGLLHVEVIDQRQGVSWVPERLAELVGRWSPRAVVLDPGSAAGSLIPALAERGIEPALVSAREVAQACGAFYDAVVEDRSLRHRDQAGLNAALAGAARRPLGDAWAWSRKDSGVDISPLVAVTLAAQAFVAASLEPEPNCW